MSVLQNLEFALEQSRLSSFSSINYLHDNSLNAGAIIIAI